MCTYFKNYQTNYQTLPLPADSTTKLLQDGAGNTDLLVRTLDVIEVCNSLKFVFTFCLETSIIYRYKIIDYYRY